MMKNLYKINLLLVLLLTLFLIPGVVFSQNTQVGTAGDFSDDNKLKFYGDVESLKNINVYPNPVSDYLYLSSDENISLTRLSIVDILGNTIWELNFEGNQSLQKIQIPIYEFKNGIYFVEIVSNFNRITKKISKE